jgi:hypothetical protein
MLNFVAALVLNVLATVAPAPVACETYAPRLDGTTVTVCAGSVSRVCDAAGNCNERPFASR